MDSLRDIAGEVGGHKLTEQNRETFFKSALCTTYHGLSKEGAVFANPVIENL